MLETIREYCLERLSGSGEGQATRRAHAAYCLVLAEEGNPDLTETESAGWLARCDLEHDNFRAALDWLFQTSDVEWSFRLCAALFRFWEMRAHLAEGRSRLESVLAMGGPGHARDRANVLVYLSTFATVQGDFPAATDFVERSLVDLPEPGRSVGHCRFHERPGDRGVGSWGQCCRAELF